MRTRFSNMGVGTRLTVGFAIVSAMLVTLLAVGVTTAASQNRAQHRIVTATTTLDRVRELKFLAADVRAGEIAYALDIVRGTVGATDDTVGRRRDFLEQVRTFENELKSIDADTVDPEDKAQLKIVRKSFVTLMDNDRQIMLFYGLGTATAIQQANELVLGPQDETFEQFGGAADRLANQVSLDVTRTQEAANQAASRARLIMIAVGLLALAVAATLATVIGRGITRPLQASVAILRTVAEGDLRPRVPSPGPDEVGQMGAAMNHTLDRIGSTLDGIAVGSTTLSSSSEELSAVSQQMSAAAEETAAQAASVSSAAEQVSHNVQAVAAGAEELGASIQEIALNTSDAARVATEAVAEAEETTRTVTKLGASSAEIGEFVRIITSIAEQTNLLALNATIEAARAGDAGRGFAVVANEVKDLARKTARSSEEIGRKVESIQADTQQAVEAINRITAVIRQINDIQTVIAASVEEQAATTSEIGRSVTEAASGSSEIARNITNVAETAQGTTQGAAETHRAAEDLARLAGDLLTLVGQFQLDGADAPALADRSPEHHEEPTVPTDGERLLVTASVS